MVDFNAFQGWRPDPSRAAEIADVPYDVVDTAEARALVVGRPDSILRVTRPDVDLPDGTSLSSEDAYSTAQRAFARLLQERVLVQDKAPGFYAYAQTMGEHRQLGLMGLASAADYKSGHIKRHEHTRPSKEDDRKRHIEAVRAHLGPVFLAYRSVWGINAQLAEATKGEPAVDFVAPDGVRHTLWPVFDPDRVARLEAAFAQVPDFYIADGHHRAAAAARVAAGGGSGEARGRFLAVAFPHDQLRIMAYNRVVADRGGRTPQALVIALADAFEVAQLTGPESPDRPYCYTMFTGGHWYRLTLKDVARPDPEDPVARLDVSVLQDRVLGPLLGIDDPRTNERIDFVGGIRGLGELERRAGAEGVAFAMHATSLDDLMAIADAGEVMPPKSTWFEPKLRTGMVVSRY